MRHRRLWKASEASGHGRVKTRRRTRWLLPAGGYPAGSFTRRTGMAVDELRIGGLHATRTIDEIQIGGLGARRKRVEDARFVRGKGHYLDDFKLPRMLHMEILRSPVAHARIISIDTSRAWMTPGGH